MNRNLSSWNKKIEGHEKRIRKDINYVMDMKKDDVNCYMKLEYTIKKWKAIFINNYILGHNCYIFTFWVLIFYSTFTNKSIWVLYL